MDADDFLAFLRYIKRELRGKKLLLTWDGLPAHRARKVSAYIKVNRSWLRVERYPAYAPELSPVEFIWSPVKTKDLAHVPSKGLAHLKSLIRTSLRRIKRNKALLTQCLRKAGVLS